MHNPTVTHFKCYSYKNCEITSVSNTCGTLRMAEGGVRSSPTWNSKIPNFYYFRIHEVFAILLLIKMQNPWITWIQWSWNSKNSFQIRKIEISKFWSFWSACRCQSTRGSGTNRHCWEISMVLSDFLSTNPMPRYMPQNEATTLSIFYRPTIYVTVTRRLLDQENSRPLPGKQANKAPLALNHKRPLPWTDLYDIENVDKTIPSAKFSGGSPGFPKCLPGRRMLRTSDCLVSGIATDIATSKSVRCTQRKSKKTTEMYI